MHLNYSMDLSSLGALYLRSLELTTSALVYSLTYSLLEKLSFYKIESKYVYWNVLKIPTQEVCKHIENHRIDFLLTGQQFSWTTDYPLVFHSLTSPKMPVKCIRQIFLTCFLTSLWICDWQAIISFPFIPKFLWFLARL